MFWRSDLTEAEEKKFRDWAWLNWSPGKPCDPMWHPIVRAEWAALDIKHAKATKEVG